MSKSISIGFTGDMAFSEYTKEMYKTPKKVDKKIYDFLNKCDYNIINFESPVTHSSKTDKASLSHKSPEGALDYVKENFKNPILSLANNHMMDFGRYGLLETLEKVKERKFKYIGAGENTDIALKYLVLGDDIKIGVLSFQYKNNLIAEKDKAGTAHDKHKKKIKKQVKELKKQVDWVVIVYHGGDEFINAPMPYTRRKLKKMLKWGADIVVAHHPHTVQGYEKVKNKMIFYSLGNFIFDTDYQRVQQGTEYGELLRIKFNKDDYEFENLDLFNNREQNKIVVGEPCEFFKDINKGYRKSWKNEARKFKSIKISKKELAKYRKLYSVKELYIDKTECNNYMEFDNLIEKHYFEGIDKKIKFDSRPVKIFKRIVKKLKNIEYRKHLYILYVKVFR